MIKIDNKKTFMFWKGAFFTFFYGFWFASGLFFSFVAGVIFYPIKPWREIPIIVIAKFYNNLLGICLKLFCDIDTKVINSQNLDFSKKKYIFAINHQCEWETLFFTTYFYPMSVVLKKELIFSTIVGVFLVYPYRSIPIDRRSFVKSFRLIVEKVKKYLDDGRHILIFPEGTRVPYGESKPLSKVVAYLAKEQDTEIVPIIHNAGKSWVKGLYTKFPGEITAYIGEPISTSDKSHDEIMDELAQKFENYKKLIG